MKFCKGQNLTLPTYVLTIDPAYLDSLDADPWSLITYPALLEYQDETYSCQIRYRGNTSLNLPKRSWKIRYDDTGPNGWDETNLNAEYRDVSICRNFLSLELAKIAGIPTPEIRHVSFIVNGVYRGVHLEIEQVDDRFFDRWNLGEGALFYAESHAARFAPPLDSEKLTDYYCPKSVIGSAIDTLGARATFLQYASPQLSALHIENIVDVENVLSYFSAMFCIANHDGYSRNYFVHTLVDGRYLLVPWDCDATFGNNWLGEYVGQEDWLLYYHLDNQAVFQRLISIPEYQAQPLDRIEFLTTAGFDTLALTLADTYDNIRNDAHQDTFKRGTNEEFDAEENIILNFMALRSGFLSNLDYFNRMELADYYVFPDYYSDTDDTLHFRVMMESTPFAIGVELSDSNSANYSFELRDDGTSGDSIPGDLIYSADIVIPNLVSPIYYCVYLQENSAEAYHTPPAGWYPYGYHPLCLPSIRCDDSPPQQGEIEITGFQEIIATGTHYFALINASTRDVNLSSCMVRLGDTYRLLRLPNIEYLAPAESLFVTNHYDWIKSEKPNSIVCGGFFFKPELSDTVLLETASGIPIASAIVDDVTPAPEIVGVVAINEINYHSAPDFDPDDWIELYCREGNVDLENWTLRDSRDDHEFTIPEGISLSEGEYLIIAKDLTAFETCFPSVSPVIGGFGFSFTGEGEDVRLFDHAEMLVDWIAYDDDEPWPEEPDGQGPTLELSNPSQPNFTHEYWRASSDPSNHGTPGGINSVYVGVQDPESGHTPAIWKLYSTYPNPFNSSIKIIFDAPRSGEVKLGIYDILGRKVASLKRVVDSAGRYNISWNTLNAGNTPVSSGIYLIRLENSDRLLVRKIILMK
jgi:spore coat protein H